MAADINSALLGLLLQGTGNNNNAWGANLNDFVFTYLENAVSGFEDIAVTGGAVSLTAAQHRAAMLRFTGILSSNVIVTIDNTKKRWRISNATSGSFTIVIKTASGTTYSEIPQNTIKDIACDGNDVVLRLDYEQAGEFVYSGRATAGPGTLACGGGTFVRADHPDLFRAIGETWGAGNGVTTAGLPNLTDTNRFLRAAGGSVAVATYQSNQNKSHTHTGSGTTSGQSATHTHTGSGTTSGQSATHTHTGSGSTGGVSANHSHTYSGTTGTESATHTHALGSAQGAFIVSVQNGAGASQGNLVNTSASVTAGLTTSTESAAHTHTYSGTSATESADHTHSYSFTTSTGSADHTHTYSFTTSTGSADHTHTYSFTTSTGSADGTEARPESAAVLICIRI